MSAGDRMSSSAAAGEGYAIEVRHLYKCFGHLEVLKDVSLTQRRGEVVCLIGASGCGKSTLLRCINGLETPTKGGVFINGLDLHRPRRTSMRCGRASGWFSSRSICSSI